MLSCIFRQGIVFVLYYIYRQGIVFVLYCIYRQGIVFALKRHPDGGLNVPPNLSFMDVLCEFVNKLIKQDRRVM